MQIESASGAAKSGTVIAIPVVHNNKTLGVMVFAQFHSLTDWQARFINRCQDSIAMALYSTIQREKLANRKQ